MMVGAGASGETASQIQSALKLPFALTDVAPTFAGLACGDETDGSANGNQLSSANAVWAESGTTFEPAYLTTLSKGFGAPIENADFQLNPGLAVTAINEWVSQHTDGQIQNLLDTSDVTSATRIVLVDAMYFNGTWDTGFDPSQTTDFSWKLLDGTEVQVPTMSGEVNVGSGFTDTMQIIELPYQGDVLAMDFLVPNAPPADFSKFEAMLTAEVLEGAFSAVSAYTQQQLYLPKFSFGSTVPLIPVLQGLGISDAFKPGVADFSGMDGMQDLYVSFVIEQAHVVVDESGTVASPLSAAALALESVLSIDQPFVFVIRDTTSGSILFMGHVTDPRQG
jgi:serpin B